MTYFVILSAGKGTRLGFNQNKGLVKLNNKSIVSYSIDLTISSKEIDKILIVSSPDDKKELDLEITKFDSNKLFQKSILGGERRQDSSYNAIKFLENKASADDVVVFHNVANPFFTKEELENLIISCKRCKASVLAQKVKDTIRKTDKNLISTKLISRENLYKMQTPQALNFQIAKSGFELVNKKNIQITDDVQVAEELGIKPQIIECSDLNFKITTKEDYSLAEYLLQKK